MLVIFISKSENIDFKATFLDTLTIIFVKSIVRKTRERRGSILSLSFTPGFYKIKVEIS